MTTMDVKMPEISTDIIKNTVKNLSKAANINLCYDVYTAIAEKYKITNKKKYSQILENILIARQTQRPLCQDTGIVVVFLEIGQNVSLSGENLEKSINDAVAESYQENFFRKSVAQDIFNRQNTKDNTPAIIYTEIVPGDKIKIDVCIKGGGSENVSSIAMLSPSEGKDGVINFIKETLKKAKDKGCPPYVLGIGLGGTMEKAALQAKKALLRPLSEESELEKEIKNALDEYEILGVKILEHPTHIASMAVALNINCHCARHASAEISENSVEYKDEFGYDLISDFGSKKEAKKLSTEDFEQIKQLKKEDEILLSGEIYTARDMAHKRIEETLQNGQNLPFDLNNKIIFYAGPCPATPDEIIGPIGPTTSARMDKYIPLYKQLKVLATIGKGERTQSDSPIYFTAQGGVASLLAKCVKKAELIAYEDLGAEAVYKLTVENFPLTVA